MKQLYGLVLMLLTFVAISCKHEVVRTNAADLPSVTTASATNIGPWTAVSGGEVTAAGASAITERGVCWSTSQNPTTSNPRTLDGNGIGVFVSNLPGLAPSTTYYVRAYAVNASGTAYGNEISFTTLPASSGLPTVSTNNATYNAGNGSVSTGGNISADGGSAVTVRGVCWSINVNPTINDSKTTNGPGTGNFTSTINGLTQGTTYYIRAYATNANGTSYGNNVSIAIPEITSPGVPTVSTNNSTYNAASSTITSGGNVSADGGSAITSRGVCWSTNPNPTIAGNKTSDGSGTGSFSSVLPGIAANNTYYIRAYATNNAGTAYGNQVTVSTNTTTGTFAVGQQFGGGIIFYIDATGQHGLIAATQDVGGSGGAKWDYRNNSTFLGATSSTDGSLNTGKIVAALGNTQSYAARLCTTYSGGVFNDWFLPSRSQLDHLYQQRNVVGGFNLSSGVYWSSTEDDDDKAWTIEFENGSNSGRHKEDNKDDNHLVRPIRAF